MTDYSLKITHTLDSALIGHWKQLWNTAANASVFNSYSWFVTQTQTHHITDYLIFQYYHHGQLVALLPVHQERRLGLSVFTAIDQDPHSPGHPLLLKTLNTELVRSFLNAITSSHPLFLSHVDKDLSLLIKQYSSRSFVYAIAKCLTLNLAADPLLRFDHNLRHDIEIRLKNNPELRFYQVPSAQVSHQLDTLISIDQHSAKKLRGGDAFSHPDNIKLFTHIFRYLPQYTQIYYLLYRSQPIAFVVCFAHHHLIQEYLTSYNNDFAKLSPGKILLYKLVQNNDQQKYKLLKLGMLFNKFNPDICFQYDIYISKNFFFLLIWRSITALRRIRQLLLTRDYFQDYKFLFKPL